MNSLALAVCASGAMFSALDQEAGVSIDLVTCGGFLVLFCFFLVRAVSR
jgi:hypothetical protein